MSFSQPFTTQGKPTAGLLLTGFALKQEEKSPTQHRSTQRLVKVGSSRFYSPIASPTPPNVKFPSAERLSKPSKVSLTPIPCSWTPLREARRATKKTIGIIPSKNSLPMLRKEVGISPGNTHRIVPLKAMMLFQSVGKKKVEIRGRKTLAAVSGRLKRLLSDPILETPPPFHLLGVIRVFGSPLKSSPKRR